jgi:hypothetical protein
MRIALGVDAIVPDVPAPDARHYFLDGFGHGLRLIGASASRSNKMIAYTAAGSCRYEGRGAPSAHWEKEGS